jgi:hypothetical protein
MNRLDKTTMTVGADQHNAQAEFLLRSNKRRDLKRP